MLLDGETLGGPLFSVEDFGFLCGLLDGLPFLVVVFVLSALFSFVRSIGSLTASVY